MGYVAITMHPHRNNDSSGYKSQVEQHPATVQIIVTVKAA
jgi:hypothetical protein